jgi:anti-sigma regulatory factor (Ser/Thr protein kinase)
VLRAPRPAQAIRDAVFRGAPAKDDVAILVMEMSGATADASGNRPPIERRFFDASDAVAGQAARRAFTEGLRARGTDPDCIANAEVVFGELVSNAARYAPGLIEVAVDWTGTAPVLHVLDAGPGVRHVPALPRDVFSESGRGLFIISELSDDFSVAKRPQGGSHARAVIASTPVSPRALRLRSGQAPSRGSQ